MTAEQGDNWNTEYHAKDCPILEWRSDDGKAWYVVRCFGCA